MTSYVPLQDQSAFARAQKALVRHSDYQFNLPNFHRPRPPEWLAALERFLEHNWPIIKWGIFLVATGLLLWAAYILIRKYVPILAELLKRRPATSQPTPETWMPAGAEARKLLEESEALAVAGHYGDAVHLLLLRSIEDIDRRRPHLVRPNLTSREIGTLQALPEVARDTFGGIASVVERALFPGEPIGAAEFERCRAAMGDRIAERLGRAGMSAQTFISARVAIGLLLVSAMSLLAYLLLSAFASDLRSGETGGGNALSKSAVGFAGIRFVLEGAGVDARIGRTPPATDRFGIVVLTPDIAGGRTALKALIEPGPRLIVLPKWITMSDPDHPGWVVKERALPKDTVAFVVSAVARRTRRFHNAAGKPQFAFAPSLKGTRAPFLTSRRKSKICRQFRARDWTPASSTNGVTLCWPISAAPRPMCWRILTSLITLP